MGGRGEKENGRLREMAQGTGHRAQGMEHGVKGFVNIVEGKKLKS
jgi:hypothetical protein